MRVDDACEAEGRNKMMSGRWVRSRGLAGIGIIDV